MVLSALLHLGDVRFTALTDADTAFVSDLQLLDRGQWCSCVMRPAGADLLHREPWRIDRGKWAGDYAEKTVTPSWVVYINSYHGLIVESLTTQWKTLSATLIIHGTLQHIHTLSYNFELIAPFQTHTHRVTCFLKPCRAAQRNRTATRSPSCYITTRIILSLGKQVTSARSNIKADTCTSL